jgi:hypothetical protein
MEKWRVSMEAWRVTLKQWRLILELEGHPGAVELCRLSFKSCSYVFNYIVYIIPNIS